MTTTHDIAEASSRNTPGWATEAFTQFLDYSEDLNRILHLSTRGISMIRAVPKVVEVLAKVKQDDDPSTVEERLEKAKEEAELAQREVDTDFPLLHAQAVVSLWGGLESLIRVFLSRWITNEPKALGANQIKKLRMQFGEYESLDREERAYYVIDLLERELQSPLKQGVMRFETILDVFGLSGQIDEDVKKNLFEMYHVRNIIVHRRGLADRKLLNACPWLSLHVGDLVTIDRKCFRRYSNSVVSYIIELIVRVAVYFGRSRSDFQDILDKLTIDTVVSKSSPDG